MLSMLLRCSRLTAVRYAPAAGLPAEVYAFGACVKGAAASAAKAQFSGGGVVLVRATSRYWASDD